MRVKVALVAGLGSFLFLCGPAAGADFIVVNKKDHGPGSLHRAIRDANNAPGLDRIIFNIPGAGVQKINVRTTPLPQITDPVVIDGYTQPGAKANTLAVGSDAIILIHVDGAGAAEAGPSGIVLAGGNSILRGLCITGFAQGISPMGFFGRNVQVMEEGGNVIEGNFIGVLPDGNTAWPHGEQTTPADGVELLAGNNLVGGITPAARNVISGNAVGVAIGSQFGSELSRSGNRITGNYIGTNASGTHPVPNFVGIDVAGGTYINTTIGGINAAEGNVISGNNGSGMFFGSSDGTSLTPANAVTIQSNLIGTAANGHDPVGNGTGILIYGSDNLIGSPESNGANSIAFNAGPGVWVAELSTTSRRNQILSNRIFENRGPAIDLGVTYNDARDSDSGPNLQQNFPVITRVTFGPTPASGTIEGTLNSTPSTEFILQLFFNDKDSEFLGSATVTTDAQGNASFTFPFTRSIEEPAAQGSYFTATATDPNGNTSEYLPDKGPVQLANISTRAFVGTDANILIGGFIIKSDQPKKIGIRALGPSVNVPNRLQDPHLELYDGNGTLLAKNDDWKTTEEPQEVVDRGLAPGSDVESVIITTLPPGDYTAQVSGVNGKTGNAVVEIYDLDQFAADSGRLVNISTRGFVGTADNVLIGGVIARGDGRDDVVVRAIGPDLSDRGVPDPLQDPTLELRDASGNLVAANDNWRENQDGEVPEELEPDDDRNAVIVERIVPAAYTAIVRGKAGTTGIALVEIYDLTN